MCRKEKLISRLDKCVEVAKKLRMAELKGYDTIVLAINSNEENNLFKAEKLIARYEGEIKNRIAVLKEQRDKQTPSVSSSSTPVQKVVPPRTAQRFRGPPTGLPPVTKLHDEVKGTKIDLVKRDPPQSKPVEIKPVSSKPLQKKLPVQPQTLIVPKEPILELKPGQKCGLILMELNNPFVYCGLTLDGKRRIRDAHNVHRSKFSKYDDGVVPLGWSNELGALAQKYAELLVSTHKWEHSKGNGDVGENLYQLQSSDIHTTSSPEAVVNAWYQEIHDFNYGTLDTKNGKMVGHFTQVISRRSTKMGAGMAKSAINGYEIWVCNYSLHGNMSMNGQKLFIDTKKITSGVFTTILNLK